LFGNSSATNFLWNLFTKDSLWRRIIIKTYIAPNSLLDQVRVERKSIMFKLNQCKSMELAFIIIGKYLAWRVGNGAHVRIETVVIMGCDQEVFLTKNLV